jgi:hypothetical protein
MSGVINDIGYTNTEGTKTVPSYCFSSDSVSISYVINDTRHNVINPSVLMYHRSLMTPIILF